MAAPDKETRAPRTRMKPQMNGGGRRFSRRRAGAGTAVQGRWSLTEPIFADRPTTPGDWLNLAQVVAVCLMWLLV